MSIAVWIIAACQVVMAAGWVVQLLILRSDKVRVARLFEFDEERQSWAREEHERSANFWAENEARKAPNDL